MTKCRKSFLGIDAFNKACQVEHQEKIPVQSAGKSILDSIEDKLDAGHSLSKEELKKKYKDNTTERLEELLASARKLMGDGKLDQNVLHLKDKAAEIQQELYFRSTSKSWLAKAKANQIDAQREQSPSINPDAGDRGSKPHPQGRATPFSKAKPSGSQGSKQVAAAMRGNGKGPNVQRTPQTGQRMAKMGSLNLQSSFGTPMRRCTVCNDHVPSSSGNEIEEGGMFVCHECKAGDHQLNKSIKGKGKAPMQIEDSDPIAGLNDDFPDVKTAATIDGKAGPSGLALKENMQPSTRRVSANTRGQQRPGLVDTRSIEVPVLKGQSGEGFFVSKLRSAASKGGTEPGSFYGSKGVQQTPADDCSAPTVRQSSRVQKRKAEQSNEPITLDDTDDEEGDGAAQALPAQRRSTRSNAYKGPADIFKGLKALYPEHGGPGAVEVVPADLVRLQPGEFLNDTIIDFYVRWIWQHMPEPTRERCYFFNSFFYKKLSEKQPGLGPANATGRCDAAKAAHERVRKWTKGLDIFEKDFLFLPIHDHLHWSLVIICHPGAPPGEDSCTSWILHLDSMTSGHHTPKIKKELLAYLTQEWDYKVSQGGESQPALWALRHPETPQRSLDIGHKRLNLPQQDNYCDCGLFLLTYADYFTHSLPEVIKTKSKKTLEPPELEALSAYPLFMQKQWFQPENAGALRGHIKIIILELFLSQVPADKKEALDDALMKARLEVEEYREDKQIPKYMSPAAYESIGQEKRRQMEQKRASDAADKLAKAAERRIKTHERKSLQGKLDSLKFLAHSDSEDEREGRRVQDKVAAPREASTFSDDIQVCLNDDDDLTASDTAERQLRSPEERSPSAKAAAAMAEQLQKDQEDALASAAKSKASQRARKRDRHVIDDDDDEKEVEAGGTPAAGQAAPSAGTTPTYEYAGRFRVKRPRSLDGSDRVDVADLEEAKASSSNGLLEEAWLCFPDEAAAKAWMDSEIASKAEQAGGRRLSGLADDGPEDLTADDGAEHKAPPTLVPDSEDGLINTTKAGLAKLASRPVPTCPDYLNSAATASAKSLNIAAAVAEHFKPYLTNGSQGHTAAAQQRKHEGSTPSDSAQQHHIGVQKLQSMLHTSFRAQTASSPRSPKGKGQKDRMQKTAYLNARHEIETDNGDAEGKGGSSRAPLDAQIDLTLDSEAPIVQGKAAAFPPDKKAAASWAEANGNIALPAQQGRASKQSQEATWDGSDRQHRQGKKQRRTRWESLDGVQRVDSSQDPVCGSSDGSEYLPSKEERHKQRRAKHQKQDEHQKHGKHRKHGSGRVDQPASPSFEQVQNSLDDMTLHSKQEAAASVLPREGNPWRTKKRSASSSPLPTPRKSLNTDSIRSDQRKYELPEWMDTPAKEGWDVLPAKEGRPYTGRQGQQPIPISKFPS